MSDEQAAAGIRRFAIPGHRKMVAVLGQAKRTCAAWWFMGGTAGAPDAGVSV